MVCKGSKVEAAHVSWTFAFEGTLVCVQFYWNQKDVVILKYEMISQVGGFAVGRMFISLI